MNIKKIFISSFKFFFHQFSFQDVKIMSSRKLCWGGIIGGLIGILGVLLFYIDHSLSFWQLSINLGVLGTQYDYLNAFGYWYTNSSSSPNQWGDPYLYAGIIVIVGAIIAFLGGIFRSKSISLIGGIILAFGLGFFIYAHITNNNLSTIAGWANVSNLLWGSLSVFSWRLGNGYIISFVGALVAIIGSAAMKKR